MVTRPSAHDPRVLRTRQWLRDALLALIVEKGFDKVTVSDIIARANVNRTTFYKHYVDKWALLESWVAETRVLLEQHALSLPDQHTTATVDAVPDIVVRIFEHIAEHAAFYRLMVGKHRLTLIVDALEHQVEAFLLQHAPRLFPASGADGRPVALTCRSHAAGFVGVVRWWLETGQQATPQQMATWVWHITADE